MSLYQDAITGFGSQALIGWFDQNKREMPWRDHPDPYAIWVSEIMLQQTRVEQAKPYYERFMREFPTVQHLAEAPEQKLMKAWEGLGYYSRARNLQAAARTICEAYDGKLPESYDELIKLKGIGPYTAAAISSIAFGEKQAAIDGNVIRVICRFFGIEEDVTKSKTKKHINELANTIISENRPGTFNEAMMELGATICTPHKPLCMYCPVQVNCQAFATAKTAQIPYKPKKKKVPHKDISVGLMFNETGEVLIAQRPAEGLLGGLWEFPGGKQEQGERIEDCLEREFKEELDVEISDIEFFMQVDHAYSHFKVRLHVFICTHAAGEPKALASQQVKWVEPKQLPEYPFPKANKVIIEKLLQRLEGDGI